MAIEITKDGVLTKCNSKKKVLDKELSGVRILQANSFKDCASDTVILPEGMTTISTSAFANSKIKHIVIPASVKKIYQTAFGDCLQLESIEFKEGSKLKQIGNGAFINCTKLKHITLPDTVEKLGSINSAVFAFCFSLEDFKVPPKVKILGASAFANCTNLKEITLPQGLEKIYDYCFVKNSNLEKIILPNTLKQIENGAFENCEKLKDLQIPASVEVINGNPFSKNPGLEVFAYPQTINKNPMLAINPCVHENTLDNLISSHMTLKDVNDLVKSDKNIEKI